MGKMKELYAQVLQGLIDEEEYLIERLRKHEEEFPTPEQYYGDRYQEMLDKYEEQYLTPEQYFKLKSGSEEE